MLGKFQKGSPERKVLVSGLFITCACGSLSSFSGSISSRVEVVLLVALCVAQLVKLLASSSLCGLVGIDNLVTKIV